MLWSFAAVLPVVLVLHITWEAIPCLANQQIAVHDFGATSVEISRVSQSALAAPRPLEVQPATQGSLVSAGASFHLQEDARLLRVVEVETQQSHVGALQDPAGHCSGPEASLTHFCITLREYAAATLTAQQLEGAEFVHKSLKERKAEAKELKRMSKAKGKMGAKAKAGRKQTDGNSRKFPGRKKSKSKKEKKGNQTDAPSMVQLPSLGDQAARQQELAKSYAEQVQRARDTAGGSSGLAGVTTAAMKIFDAALYLQAGTLLLTGMAKELLGGIVSAAAATTEGTSIQLDPGEVEGLLRSVLVQGSSFAQPLTPFCVSIIEEALNRLSSKAKNAEETTAEAFLALQDLDTLVCSVARLKAELTATHLQEPPAAINERVKLQSAGKAYAGLPKRMSSQVIELVLSIVDEPEAITVVKYTRTSSGRTQLSRKGAKVSVEQTQQPLTIPSTPQVDMSGKSPIVVPPVPAVLVTPGSTRIAVESRETESAGHGTASGVSATAGDAARISAGTSAYRQAGDEESLSVPTVALSGQQPSPTGNIVGAGQSGWTSIQTRFPSTNQADTSRIHLQGHPASAPQGAQKSIQLHFGSTSASAQGYTLPDGPPMATRLMRFGEASPVHGAQSSSSASIGVYSHQEGQASLHTQQMPAKSTPGNVENVHTMSHSTSSPKSAPASSSPLEQGQTSAHITLLPSKQEPIGVHSIQSSSVEQEGGPWNQIGQTGVHIMRFGDGQSGITSSRLAGTVDAAQFSVPGLVGTAVPLTSLPFYDSIGETPAFGARFHGAQVDYALGNTGTTNDICVTESMVFPSVIADKGAETSPAQSLGALAASAVERWALRKAHEVVHESVTLFHDNEAIRMHVKKLLESHIAKLKEATAPAPSFNSLTSSGSKSYSDDARRIFHQHFSSPQLFSMVKEDHGASLKLRLRAELLEKQGIIPTMPAAVDKTVTEELRKIQNSVHEDSKKAKKAPKYGFLDVCGKDCYTKTDTKAGDVMTSVVYSLDSTLTRLNSAAYRGLTLSATFFGGLGHIPSSSQQRANGNFQEALETVLNLWKVDTNNKRGKTDTLDVRIVTAIEKYAEGLERFVNILFQSPRTQHLYNLAAHTWVQMRAVRNAAEGFLPGKVAKLPDKDRQVAAIFSKLWFEMDLAVRQHDDSILKPFPGMMASLMLQVAFFLHTVAEEFQTNIFKRMGAAVKSFFAGMLRKNKKMKVPGSWAQIQERAEAQQTSDPAGFQGALHAITQLSSMFHKRFLQPVIDAQASSPIAPAYIAFIHGIVGQWMVPHNEKLNISDPRIPRAKKIFYYNIFSHPQGLIHVAKELIKSGCAGVKSIDMGRVVATIESSGKRQTVGTTILKLRPVPVKPSDLEYHLNTLMATYSDPMDIVRVAQDLASRCKAEISPTLPSEPQEPAAPKDSKGAKRSKSPKQPKKGEPKNEWVAQILSSKFVLDSWCLKYKDFVMQNMAGVPKTTDGKKLFLLLEGELDKTVEIVLTPSSMKASWVMNLKCPFMRDFVDPDFRQTAREGMLQYALSRRSLGRRLGRKLRAIGNFFSKKFTWKRKSLPGAAANNEWAIINVGTGIWDSTRYRFEHTLTFRPENMSCGTGKGPRRPIDFQGGHFIIGSEDPEAEQKAVLCVKDSTECWATERALMLKGSTEPPVLHSQEPAGPWYSRLPGAGAAAPSAP